MLIKWVAIPGARHGVLLGLKRKNVNFDKSSLEIRWSQRRFSESYVCETGTSMKAVEFARIHKDCWRKIASLTMSARVKHLSSAPLHALKEKRHFALVEVVAFPTVMKMNAQVTLRIRDPEAEPTIGGRRQNKSSQTD
jgi:integrase